MVNVIVYPISVTLSFGVGIAAIYISKYHWNSQIFGRSYLALGIGYFSYGLGEIVFTFLNIFEYETYPSIADVFFFLVYPFIFIHMFLNLKYFKTKLTKTQKILLPLIFFSFYYNI